LGVSLMKERTHDDAVAPLNASFDELVTLIKASRQRAFQAVNAELVGLYWQVGEYISRKLASAEWGDKVVDELARYLARTQPGLKGFTRRNLFRMRQFYEAYSDNEMVTPLVTQLPWMHNLIILGQSKRPEEREFYLKIAPAGDTGFDETLNGVQIHPSAFSAKICVICG